MRFNKAEVVLFGTSLGWRGALPEGIHVRMRQRALSPASGAGTRQAAEGGGVEGGQPG